MGPPPSAVAPTTAWKKLSGPVAECDETKLRNPTAGCTTWMGRVVAGTYPGAVMVRRPVPRASSTPWIVNVEMDDEPSGITSVIDEVAVRGHTSGATNRPGRSLEIVTDKPPGGAVAPLRRRIRIHPAHSRPAPRRYSSSPKYHASRDWAVPTVTN